MNSQSADAHYIKNKTAVFTIWYTAVNLYSFSENTNGTLFQFITIYCCKFKLICTVYISCIQKLLTFVRNNSNIIIVSVRAAYGGTISGLITGV